MMLRPMRQGGERPSKRWLMRSDGQPYRCHADARVFEVVFQPAEGALWRPVCQPDGRPIVLPLTVTPAAFVAAVASAPGVYQLVPCDLAGVQRGDPPQRIDLDAAGALNTAPRAIPIPLTPHLQRPRASATALEPTAQPARLPASIERLRRRAQGT